MSQIQPKTLFVGKNTIFLPTCHSTNDIATQMIQNEEVFEGTVVWTTHQTAGRGQRGNTWVVEADTNLTFSLILRPHFLRADEQFALSMAVSVAVREFLAEFLDDTAQIKWPNDMYAGQKKIGGILIENTLQGYHLHYSVIGIGLNINQLRFDGLNATSLKAETLQPYPYNLSEVLERLLTVLEKYYLLLKTGQGKLKESYLQHLFRYQEYHYYEANGQRFLGQIVGVTERGHLAIETEGTVLYFDVKEVTFVIDK